MRLPFNTSVRFARYLLTEFELVDSSPISLMPDQNKLVLANASGDAPDIATGLNYAQPYELAIIFIDGIRTCRQLADTVQKFIDILRQAAELAACDIERGKRADLLDPRIEFCPGRESGHLLRGSSTRLPRRLTRPQTLTRPICRCG